MEKSQFLCPAVVEVADVDGLYYLLKGKEPPVLSFFPRWHLVAFFSTFR